MKLKIKRPKSVLKPGRHGAGSALFVGNDINNGIEGASWSDLVKHLIELVGAHGKFDLATESFPLIYEQLYLDGMRTGKLKKELELKEVISDWASRIQPSEIHDRILRLGVEHIITPNYDFALEKAGGLKGSEPERDGARDESVYSLFRLYKTSGYKFWHIHGDVLHPRSINLGYEQYGGSLHRMRDYVMTGRARDDLGGALMTRLDKGGESIAVQSWLDLFFTRNLYIFGFRFDQVEMHLWWLLAYRARRIVGTRKRPANQRPRFCPQNRIVYFYPKSLLRDITRVKTTRRRLKLLDSFGVETVGCAGAPGEKGYYNAVLKSISNHLSANGGRTP